MFLEMETFFIIRLKSKDPNGSRDPSLSLEHLLGWTPLERINTCRKAQQVFCTWKDIEEGGIFRFQFASFVWQMLNIVKI